MESNGITSNANGPTKNWVDFQQAEHQMPPPLANGPNKASKFSALMEPVELNEIPLHDIPVRFPAPESNKGKGNINPGTSSNSGPTDQQEKLKNNLQGANKKDSEVILKVGQPSASGTGNGPKEQTANASENDPHDGEIKNGKLLTTVYPTNIHCAWFSPPKYDGIKMPPILGNKKNSLPSTVFGDILQTITSDLRFSAYAVMFSRITPLWLVFAILVLLAVLASSPAGGFPIMVFAFVWLIMLILGLLCCVLIRKYMVLSLRNLLKDVNKVSLQYRLLVEVQDRGQLSCHKVALLFIFYDSLGCREDIARQLRIQQSQSMARQSTNEEITRSADELLTDYAQAYGKALMKRRFLFPTRPSEGVSDFRPKHCPKSLCICQYIEKEHFNKKLDKKFTVPWYESVFAV